MLELTGERPAWGAEMTGTPGTTAASRTGTDGSRAGTQGLPRTLLQSHWQDLADHLRALAGTGRPLRYVPNEGNAGDALIASGTWQFFEDCGLHVQTCRRRQIRPGDVVIYSGGGNLVPEYRRCARLLETCLRRDVHAAVVLPHTIRGHERLLARLDGRFTLVCRERVSARHVAHHAPQARLLQAPDMALWLDPTRLAQRCRQDAQRRPSWLGLLIGGNLWRYARWRRGLAHVATQMRDGALVVMRSDVEAPNDATGNPMLDLSGLYGSAFRQRSEADLISRDLLDLVARADSVRTNRLHVGVAAALLGRPVTLMDNIYGKIRDVHDASLRGLPHVRFEG